MRMIPSPPEFLLAKPQEPVQDIVQEAAADSAPQIPEASMPPTVDSYIYMQAIEDRREAETGYAEIYSQYLEVVGFNEKLLRTLAVQRRFRARVRAVYDRAKLGDQVLAESAQAAHRNLVATEKALGDLQLENESLRISLSSHEEAFRQLAGRLGQAEAAMDKAREQFQMLAEECDSRGLKLADAERKVKTFMIQIEQMADAMREMQGKFTHLRDENQLFQNQMRDAQLREAGISALNSELTESVMKLQKQIHEMEDKLFFERENSKKRISELDQEIERLRENRHAENLVEESKRLQTAAVAEDRKISEKPQSKELDRENLDRFYQRWSQIIDELSSHSGRIDHAPRRSEGQERPAPNAINSITEQLISERGDLDLN
jgi:chromosome segregation ATPase